MSKQLPLFTTRFNYEPIPGLTTTQPSKAYQEGKDECDINILYRRYLSKGMTPPNVVQLEARYADITKSQSYEEILNVQQDVKRMFNDLPSEIREACGYNVDNFVKVISTPSVDEDVREFQTEVFDKLGMLDRKQEFAEIRKQAETPKEEVIEPKKEEASTPTT